MTTCIEDSLEWKIYKKKILKKLFDILLNGVLLPMSDHVKKLSLYVSVNRVYAYLYNELFLSIWQRLITPILIKLFAKYKGAAKYQTRIKRISVTRYMHGV